MITRFYFLRHAKSEALEKGIVQGEGLNIPLTAEGKAQARRAANYLVGTHFDTIFTSTAIRAVSTAEAIRQFHKKTPCFQFSELNERSKGVAEGVLKKEFDKKYPNILADWSKEIDARPEGGENFEDVERRVMPVLNKHLQEFPGKSILYVIHGNVIRVVLGHMLNIPYGKRARIKQDYCALNGAVYDHDKGLWNIEFVNFKLGETGKWI